VVEKKWEFAPDPDAGLIAYRTQFYSYLNETPHPFLIE